MVYPDDVVAVQHTLDSGMFLHCLESDASGSSPWLQSFVSLRGAEWGGWWDGGLTSLPQGIKWVDGVVCNLRILYEDKIHRPTERGDILDSLHVTAASVTSPLTEGPISGSNFKTDIIHPHPDENNYIHVQINVPTIIVIKALFGDKARSSWSAPVLQTDVPFRPSCPDAVTQFVPDCKRKSKDCWFSSVTLELPSPGVQTLNVSVEEEDMFQSLSVKVQSYEAVMGLSVGPRGCPRTVVHRSQVGVNKYRHKSAKIETLGLNEKQ